MSTGKEVNLSNAAVCVWDFTLFDNIDAMTIQDTLAIYCKKWAFQKEKGNKTGKVHWQGRFSLKTRNRRTPLINIFSSIHNWKNFHFSITSNLTKDNTNYVMKDEGRIEGPYCNNNHVYIPRDMRNIKELYPWQNTLKDILKVPDDRIIDFIIDPIGCCGKSTFMKWMRLYEGAGNIPYCNDFKDLMQMAHCIGNKSIWTIDMPKAISKEKLKGFFSGIESLKNGYIFDTRYKFVDRLFDPPRIAVFSNLYPKKSYLSSDRWRLWLIDCNKQLKSTEFKEVENDSIDGLYDKDRAKIAYEFDINNIEFLGNDSDNTGGHIIDLKYKLMNDPVYCRRLLNEVSI